MTGTTWVQESGFLAGPVIITNTNSVGVARDAVVAWQVKANPEADWSLPVVAETYDGMLNDINGFHVKPEHVWQAIETATGGRVTEGSVGGGTGMICNGFKGGIGTSSRVTSKEAGGYTVGVLVQCNYGGVRGLRIAGVPVGREVPTFPMCMAGSQKPSSPLLRGMKACTSTSSMVERPNPELGSIIIVIATDAPLLPGQLERIVKRASLGIGREGGIASNYSGDIFIAFSTANLDAARSDTSLVSVTMMPNESMDPLFAATIQATEEAITNAMIAADTMVGADSLRVAGLPHKWLQEVLKKYNRLDSLPAR
jgi:L-aminopeptidase/D-esterase-like protein